MAEPRLLSGLVGMSIKSHKTILLVYDGTQFQMFERFGVATLHRLVRLSALFYLLQIVKEVYIFGHTEKLKVAEVELDAPIPQHECPVVFIVLADQIQVLFVLLARHILLYVFLFKID